MIEQHPSFPQPADPKMPLWRYMDLAKFLSLIQTGKLYFPRADLLGDPFEGSVSLANAREWERVLGDKELRKGMFGGMPDDQVQLMRDTMAASRRETLRESFVSCWHAAEHESAAMWSLYGRSGEAIAVQTTFEKLAAALPSEVSMGTVRYIDYERDFIDEGNIFNVLMSKRRSFEHEKEVRAIIWAELDKLRGKSVSDDGQIEINNRGASIAVNLPDVIERIFVGPTAPEWYADVVRNVVDRYGLTIPVEQSSLAADPVF